MPINRGLGIRHRLAAFGLCLSLAAPLPAWPCSWSWGYSGAGIIASGTLTTTPTPDANGYFLITGITGTRNGAAITMLQPTGKPIPGNEPFGGDNLIRLAKPQLTKHGFGFATAKGGYANPFYADFLAKPSYLEFFSQPTLEKSGSTELPVLFSAVIAAPGRATTGTAGCSGAKP